MNIGEAKSRLSELVAAAVRGDDVVLQRAGQPVVRLVPMEDAAAAERAALRAQRQAALGMYRDEFANHDLSLQALKADRTDTGDRWDAKLARLR